MTTKLHLMPLKKKKYNEYIKSDRFYKTKYGMENVSGRTTPAFRKEFPKLNESTVRGLMKNMSKNENARKR